MREYFCSMPEFLKGWREGLVESKREDLLEFLRGRFGPLPAAFEQRIANTSDLATLTRWVRAAATVAKPEDLPL